MDATVISSLIEKTDSVLVLYLEQLIQKICFTQCSLQTHAEQL